MILVWLYNYIPAGTGILEWNSLYASYTVFEFVRTIFLIGDQAPSWITLPIAYTFTRQQIPTEKTKQNKKTTTTKIKKQTCCGVKQKPAIYTSVLKKLVYLC